MKKLFTITLSALAVCAFAQNPEGGSLSANPTAQPDVVCSGQPVHLIPSASGGSSNYTYNWTSNPPGFSSSTSDPYVTPLSTTEYTVEVNDGNSTTSATVIVVVNPLPYIDLIPQNDTNITVLGNSEISICAFTSLTLDAGNTGCTYAWNNGSTDRLIQIGASGICYDIQEYQVNVTNTITGCSNSGTLKVHYSFADCSYGIDSKNLNEKIHIFPNPSPTGIIYCSIEGLIKDLKLEVFTSLGNKVDHPFSSIKPSSRLTINLDFLDTGVYYLKFSNEEFVTTKKLIIK